MSTVYLMGGLGNQLFQFAAGYVYSQRHKEELYIDLGYVNQYPAHGGYRLDRLLLSDYISGTIESNAQERFKNRTIIKLPILTRFFNGRFYHESFHSSEKNDVTSSACPIMLGYWQDVKFFHEAHSFLKSIIVPRNISKRAQVLQSKIADKSMSSVSIHVRRGDYINNESVLKVHGVCSIDYYNNAIARIKEYVQDIRFFVFTNDVDWVGEKFKDLFLDTDVIFVGGNSQEEDLWLMSQAKHHIIANSSFSWWGAWLAKHETQIVIAPTPWYDQVPKYSIDPSLAEWIRLPK
ncbi:alpha-1,2-fucosyltransferase [Aeromonas caviae]|uniref:alpha-1,2-fucosyltransferase n=1 Tax=Aeromonas caviae TaxID=648 RepID=UPI000B2CD111|nr:alpha-1,2-fucosyltransferase [Aeromonas caviae]